eukprot:gene43604-58071_t
MKDAATAHGSGAPSEWIVRWSHLLAPDASVLDVACGSGRHMRWFAGRGHTVTGVDRSPEAVAAASAFGRVVEADIESGELHAASLVAGLVVERSTDVAVEQRVAVPRRGLEFGVELHAYEPRVHAARQLDDLGQLFGLGDGGDHQAGLLQLVQVEFVGLIAVAVALVDDRAVDLIGQGAGLDVRALGAQAHGTAQVGVGIALLHGAVAVLPLVDQGDHRVLVGGLELGGV